MNLKKNHEKDKTKNRINPCSQETRERININYFKKDKMTNNKLIAQFMGFPQQSDVVDDRTTAYYIGDVIKATNENNQNEDNVFHPDDMMFDSSWDWLMPVIDKISGIKNWSINATLDWLSASEFNIQQESDGFYTMEDVYLAVVEFIKLTNLKQQ